MSRGQRILFRAIGAITSIAVLLIIFYNLSPNYVDEQGFLVEEFWAIALASFGLVGSLLGLLCLVFWIWLSNRKAI